MAELDPYSVSISLSTMLSLTCTFKVKNNTKQTDSQRYVPFHHDSCKEIKTPNHSVSVKAMEEGLCQVVSL